MARIVQFRRRARARPAPWPAALAFAALLALAAVAAPGKFGTLVDHVFGALAPTESGGRDRIAGRATVIDGDTLEIRGERIRLDGVDAPESRQTCRDASGAEYRCGQQAALALADRVAQGTLDCEVLDRDRYGRHVARCVAGGAEVNEWLVSAGWALAYREYSRAYIPAEESARRAGRGLWAGEFVAPWDWRRGERG